MTHNPVLLRETVDSLAVKPGGVYVDGTLGRAGHAREILARAGAGARLVGIDRDAQALAESAEILDKTPGANVTLAHGCHGDIARIARDAGVDSADGVLLDLGVSSPQLDEADRGFSFRADGPLDMRMDRSCGETAADLVATRSEEELADILRTLGEEPNARRIAKAIVRARADARIETTAQLAALVERAVGRRGAHHPATRTFQAIRMAVNDEMGELERALAGGLDLLKPGGRFAVITFESLTDRAVKRFFAAHAGKMVSLQQGGERWEGDLPRVRLATRRAVTASEEEIGGNPRARSAKLRAIERIEI
ncbi:MAG: 16S rRNA (cytosine(1402)-N(4))-methyltransferase RsmH [Kiritimatiellae bacterium]|nr:16S rRNA (cytosine(1402)-N(4))-methyltransferase RsmH [Kiritimatiellia bacterium]